MNKIRLNAMFAVALIVVLPVVSAALAQNEEYTGPVTELAIRRLNEEMPVEDFVAAREAFIAVLQEQEGVIADREFAPFLDFGTFMPPEPPVFIGMTEYEDIEAFAAVGESLGESEELGAFFSTFTPEVFTALRPLDPDTTYDLTEIATEPGQVFEVAVRDLSAYEDFDEDAYEAARVAFLEELSEQEGFVAEYQWVSVLDPDIVVGMTVYESGEAFQAIAAGDFGQSETYANFLGYFPVVGYASFDARMPMDMVEDEMMDDGEMMEEDVEEMSEDEMATEEAS